MEQLISSVGFRGIDTEPKSFYVNDIPGMAKEILTAVNDTGTVESFIEKLHASTAGQFRRMIMTALSKKCDWKLVLAKFPQSNIAFKPLFYAPENAVCTINCGVGNKYTAVCLSEIIFAAKNTGTAQINVYKEPVRELIDTVNVNVTAGKNRLTVSFPAWTDEITAQQIAIELLPSTGLQLYEFERNALTNDLSVTDTFLSGEAAPAFIICNARIESRLDALIDNYAEQLAEAYAYQLAANLLEFKLSSYKLNLFTNSKREDSEHRSMEYPKEAEKALRGIINTLADEITSAQFVPFEPEASSKYSLGGFNVFDNEGYY